MGDRVRLGELLAAIGAIGLAFLLAFGAWFSYDSLDAFDAKDGVFSPVPEYGVSGSVGSTHLGWFALAIAAISAAAGLVYLARVLTASNSERPMLQAPVAYAVGLFAFLVVFVRVILFKPEVTLQGQAATLGNVVGTGIPTGLALGGILGLVATFLIPFGTWIAMADDRTSSRGAQRRTEALLGGITVRQAPLAGVTASPEAEAFVVADDAAGDDSTNPSGPASPDPASGGPA